MNGDSIPSRVRDLSVVFGSRPAVTVKATHLLTELRLITFVEERIIYRFVT